MPIYPDTSQNHPDQGMPLSDIRACERVAARRNEIIMFRSTGCWARPLIAAGYPTKPYHVKGKSATWGPQAGFVPLDSEFSKAVSARDIEKGRALNAAAVNGNYARPVSLVLRDEYIQAYLLPPRSGANRRAVDRITEPRDGIRYFFCTKPGEDDGDAGTPYVFLGRRNREGAWEIFAFPRNVPEKTLFLKESAAEPLLVLAVAGSGLPITGDYDLFAVCPSWAQYGSKDRKLDPTLDDPKVGNVGATIARVQLRGPAPRPPQYTLPAYDSAAELRRAPQLVEDPDRGNLTARIFELICALNAEMGAPYGPGMEIGKPNVYAGGIVNQRVHHNAESGRPFAPGAEDGFPLTTFHPGPVGPYHFRNATINDVGDLRTYFNTLYANGYYVPRNRAWQMPSLNPLLPGYRA